MLTTVLHRPDTTRPATTYRGPERRRASAPPPLAALMAMMLDEIDYGVILVAPDRQVLHLNHAARAELTGRHPLQLLGRELRARLSKDVVPLHEALHAASQRGLRRLLSLGEAPQACGAAVVPLAPEEAGAGGSATLLVLGKRQVCGALSVQGFARAHRLSAIEELVLRGLCEGDSPQEIANRHGVKIATVRTQISSIRAKTGSDSIRDLVHQVAVLPPMVEALRAAPGVAAAQDAWALAAA